MLKNRTIILITLILITAALLHSQYDHKQVMMNQIRRLEARREFSQALQLYEELVRRHPDDEDVIAGYFNTLLNLNRIDDAAQVLEDKRHLFAEEVYTQQRISFLMRQGNRTEARRIGIDYLRQNPGIVNLYRSFATVFERERDSETAVEVLKLARRTSRDDYLFAMELARNYENLSDYPNSIKEYIKHLERNTGFLYFVTNRMKNILNEVPAQIRTMQQELAESDNEVLLELYALSLAHTGDFENAFLVYQRLDPEKLNKFADELFASGNIELARQAYEKYRLSITDPVKSADVGIKIALLYISDNQLTAAQQVLQEIADDKKLHDRQLRFRTRANRQARELLADIAIRLDKPQQEVIELFDEAKNFAFNRNEQKEIDLKNVHYLIMSEEYRQAQQLLQAVLRDEQSGSHITNMGHYYKFMLNLMANNEPDDSLLTEMIIAAPGSELTNEALFMTVIFHEMTPQTRDPFLKAYRLKSLYKEREALETLLNIDKSIYDEEIIIITGEWALETGDLELAQQLFSHPFRNDTLAGYAVLKKAEIRQQEKNDYRDILTTFLTKHPTHIFSPKIRLLLTNP